MDRVFAGKGELLSLFRVYVGLAAIAIAAHFNQNRQIVEHPEVPPTSDNLRGHPSMFRYFLASKPSNA